MLDLRVEFRRLQVAVLLGAGHRFHGAFHLGRRFPGEGLGIGPRVSALACRMPCEVS
ncbi:MAG: hypothetical protein R3E96_05595 [Planctomycetota bacterium]